MKNINTMSTRAAMGFPETYENLTQESNRHNYQRLRQLGANELVQLAEDCNTKFAIRWTAAQLLAVIGDPRINPLDPCMCDIPASTANIGSTLSEIQSAQHTYEHVGVKQSWLEKEYPQHEIKLSAYAIAKYPVTNYEYLIFLHDHNHIAAPTAWQFGRFDESKANHPVYGVTIQQAQQYATWLSKKTGRLFCLPSEYEWEYAAAGSQRREFPWGNEFLADHANTVELGLLSTTPVGLFPRGQSEFGCFDMAGNVEEYVNNKYFAYPGGKYIKDDLTVSGQYHVARGGSFTRFADLARTRRRHGYYPKPIYAMGFRLKEELL